jgi:hypothetical protein
MMSAANASTRAMATSTDVMGASMGRNVGKVSKMAKLLSGMAGLSFAALAGWDIGTFVSKAFVEPHAEEQAKAQDELEDATRKARELMRRPGAATFEEKTAALERLSTARGYAPETLKSSEAIAGTLASVFTGEESPSARLLRKTEAAKAEEARLRGSIQSDIGALRGVRKQAEAGSAAFFNPLAREAVGRRVESALGTGQGAQVNIGDTNISITAPTGNADDISRELNRTLDKRDRQQVDAIRRAAQTTSPGEF